MNVLAQIKVSLKYRTLNIHERDKELNGTHKFDSGPFFSQRARRCLNKTTESKTMGGHCHLIDLFQSPPVSRHAREIKCAMSTLIGT